MPWGGAQLHQKWGARRMIFLSFGLMAVANLLFLLLVYVEKIPDAMPDMPGSTVAREDTCMLVSPAPDAMPPTLPLFRKHYFFSTDRFNLRVSYSVYHIDRSFCDRQLRSI
jgi:hypothetical protein